MINPENVEDLALVRDGKVYVEINYLLELTDSPEFEELEGKEFATYVRLGMRMLEAMMLAQSK